MTEQKKHAKGIKSAIKNDNNRITFTKLFQKLYLNNYCENNNPISNLALETYQDRQELRSRIFNASLTCWYNPVFKIILADQCQNR